MVMFIVPGVHGPPARQGEAAAQLRPGEEVGDHLRPGHGASEGLPRALPQQAAHLPRPQGLQESQGEMTLSCIIFYGFVVRTSNEKRTSVCSQTFGPFLSGT